MNDATLGHITYDLHVAFTFAENYNSHIGSEPGRLEYADWLTPVITASKVVFMAAFDGRLVVSAIASELIVGWPGPAFRPFPSLSRIGCSRVGLPAV